MPKRKKQLFVIIDAYSLIHRAWHAIPHLITKEGEVVNAVYGFTSLFLKMIKELNPTHIAITFDHKAPTFRHEEYKEYKATRKKQPQELYDQIPRIQELMGAFNIPIFELPGYEADDLIATICDHPEVDKPDLQTTILTGDLDTLQLVDANTNVLTLRRGFSDTITYDKAAIKERFNLTPVQTIDYKALRGDPSDNIPGVPGIGEKTASDLIEKFDSVENLYEALAKKSPKTKKISERIQTILLDNKKEAFKSKSLVTLVHDAPIKFSLKAAKLTAYDVKAVKEIFQELEFSSLLNKLPKIDDRVKDEDKPVAKLERPSGYHLVDSDEALDKFITAAQKQKLIAIDTETTGLDPLLADLVGLSASWAKGQAYYIPLLNNQEWINKLKPFLENPKIGKAAHNGKFDMAVLSQQGINLSPLTFDSMIASYLLNPGSRAHKLDNLAFAEFGHEMIPIEQLIGKGKKQITMADVPINDVASYAAEDADYTWQLVSAFKPQLKSSSTYKVFNTIEMPLIPVLANMESAGVLIDVKFLKAMSKSVGKKLATLEKNIYKLAGTEFNISSPKQLKEILFDKLEISTAGLSKTKTGVSTAASELEKLRDVHPIINEIFSYRELSKLKSTYLDALPELVNPKTKRVHTSFNQTITATGRLSSSNPNLQNIPIRTELGREIRKAFIADPGFKLIAADYSQIELRLAADVSKEKNMIAAFKKGADIHTATAAGIYRVKDKDVNPEMRRTAKTVNFGILYGMGPGSLSAQTELNRSEAKQFIAKYFEHYPKLKGYIEKTKEQARIDGYVQTIFGRKRPMPEILSGIPMIRAQAERMAVNMPLQGTGADLMKLAMIEIFKELPNISPQTKMLIQVHDELVFEVPSEDVKKVAKFIKKKMEEIHKFDVPLVVDVKSGNNWGEMSEI